MSYFHFYSKYKLEIDAEENVSCLYDLLNKERFCYGYSDTICIKELIEKMWEEITNEEVRQLARRFIVEGKGYIYLNKVYTEDYSVNTDVCIYGLFEPIPFLENLHIRLNGEFPIAFDDCSEKKMINACFSDIQWGQEGEGRNDLSVKIIDFFKGMYINNIIFGGVYTDNDIEKMKYIITNLKAGNDDVSFSLISNGTLNKKIVDLCDDYNIELIITICESDLEIISDDNGDHHVWADVLEWADYMSDCGIFFSINYVAQTMNYSKGKEKILEKGWKIKEISEMIGNGKLNTIPGFSERKEVKRISFPEQRGYNNCLNKRIAVDAFGNVYPCPVIEKKIGNIYTDLKKEIFSQKNINKWWKRRKDDFDLCRGCIYRHGCEECIYLEMLCEQDIVLPQNVCCNMGGI